MEKIIILNGNSMKGQNKVVRLITHVRDDHIVNFLKNEENFIDGGVYDNI